MTTYLLCPPDHFAVHFLGNPWLDWQDTVNPDRARVEWEALRAAIMASGGCTALIPAQPGASAMTFVRDAALMYAPRQALLLRNDGARGEVEPQCYGRWFRKQGYRTETSPYRIDGGNILRCTDGRYLVGIKPEASGRVERYLARLVARHGGARCLGIPLADPRYLHLDLVLADLGGRGWLVYPDGFCRGAFSHPAWKQVFLDRPVITVDRDEAGRLACNVVVVGETVIGGGLSPRLARAIERLGLTAVPTPLDEFVKAGGGAHCLTLECSPDIATVREPATTLSKGQLVKYEQRFQL